MGEIVFIAALVASMLALAIIAGKKKRYFNMAFWIFIGVGLAVFEVVAVIFTDMTISQHHWIMTTENSWTAWVVRAMTALLFINVLIHFEWKALFDKGYAKRKKGDTKDERL